MRFIGQVLRRQFVYAISQRTPFVEVWGKGHNETLQQ